MGDKVLWGARGQSCSHAMTVQDTEHWAPAGPTLIQLSLPLYLRVCAYGGDLPGRPSMSSCPSPAQHLRRAGRDYTCSSADQRPRASHCLAPWKLSCLKGSGPFSPWSFLGQASPRGPGAPVEAAVVWWLYGWGTCGGSSAWVTCPAYSYHVFQSQRCRAGTCMLHPLGSEKQAAGAVRAPCRRQPIMLY